MGDVQLISRWICIYLLIAQVACVYSMNNYFPTARSDLTRDQLITSYFNLGYSQTEIVSALALIHSIQLSVRHLRRILKKLSLQRKRLSVDYEADIDRVIEAILKETSGSGCCLGYKSMWRRLVHNYGLCVKRQTVVELMWLIDPEGMEKRKAKRLVRRAYFVPGPNFLFHIDGYDKLKPYGFAIHGCIDGFSRRIMWLKVGSSNNDPRVIAKYFLQCIEEVGGVPTLICSDMGTENATIKLLQAFFRTGDGDRFAGINSFIMGKSTANQRIESWWSILRKKGVQFWMSFFKDLRACDLFRDDIIHQECARLCFMDILQNELQCVVQEWNTHIIHTKKGVDAPSGKPDVMYRMPELYDTHSYLCKVENFDFQEITQLYAIPTNDIVCNPIFRELCEHLLPGMVQPMSFDAAFELYAKLIVKIRQTLYH